MTARALRWSDKAAKGLARALDPIVLELIAREVQSGLSTLWHCKSDAHEAFCVTRIDNNPREFVFVAFEGSGVLEFGPKFISAAKSLGLPMRLHTMSPVVARLVRRLGFDYDPQHVEMIIRKVA